MRQPCDGIRFTRSCRMLNKIFMTYPYAQSNRGMYEKIMAGQEVNTGWVYDSDFEPEWVEKH